MVYSFIVYINKWQLIFYILILNIFITKKSLSHCIIYTRFIKYYYYSYILYFIEINKKIYILKNNLKFYHVHFYKKSYLFNIRKKYDLILKYERLKETTYNLICF